MNTNQIGRELVRLLIEKYGCEQQTAVRFFYNSNFYTQLANEDLESASIQGLFARLDKEFQSA